jgi:hypothetical protein
MADVSNFALTNKIIKRPKGLIYWGRYIWDMLLIEVDVIRFKASKTVFNSAHDVSARGSSLMFTFSHWIRKLCCDDNATSVFFGNRVAKKFFREALTTIHISSIEKVNAQIYRSVNHFIGCALVAAPPKVIATYTHLRHFHAG